MRRLPIGHFFSIDNARSYRFAEWMRLVIATRMLAVKG